MQSVVTMVKCSCVEKDGSRIDRVFVSSSKMRAGVGCLQAEKGGGDLRTDVCCFVAETCTPCSTVQHSTSDGCVYYHQSEEIDVCVCEK